MCVCSVAQSSLTLFMNPWTVARQAPLSIRFPRQEYWTGLSFPPPKVCIPRFYFDLINDRLSTSGIFSHLMDKSNFPCFGLSKKDLNYMFI